MEKQTRRKLLMAKLRIQLSIALILSLVMTAINYGFKGAFVQHWAKAFVVAFVIILLALRFIPLVAKGVRGVVGDCPAVVQRSAVAVCVAVMMEALIAFAVTMAQYGLASGWPLMWANTFVKALPFGLVIGFTMTFIVQPRMQRLAASA